MTISGKMKRALLKTLSWKMVSTTVTLAVVVAQHGDFTSALKIALADTGVKFFVMLAHERIWA